MLPKLCTFIDDNWDMGSVIENSIYNCLNAHIMFSFLRDKLISNILLKAELFTNEMPLLFFLCK